MNFEDAYLGRVFGSLGTSSSLLMFVGTLTAGAVGGILGPIVLLNFQGGAYVAAGLFILHHARAEPGTASRARVGDDHLSANAVLARRHDSGCFGHSEPWLTAADIDVQIVPAADPQLDKLGVTGSSPVPPTSEKAC